MTTRAKDIMTTEMILGYPKMTLEEAIKTLVNNRITGMPIVDDNKHIVGVISEYDIIKVVRDFENEQPLNLSNIIQYSERVTTIPEETPLGEVLKQFVELKIRRLPVVNKNNQLVGIITRRDIMRVLFYRSKPL
jgi:CBS domain-containing protein